KKIGANISHGAC
ncbi:hypothetical protein CISIN_1g0410152mg, partial [Citrus sinensis]